MAKITGNSTVKYWMDNDLVEDDLPKPHYKPISYVKIAFCWAMYYLKNSFNYEDAL